MKKLLLFVSVGISALGMLGSCSSKGGDEKAGITHTGGSANHTVYADGNTGSGGVTFRTEGSWGSSITEGVAGGSGESRAAATWIRISPSSGAAGNHTVNIELDTNFDGVDRKATITITSMGESIGFTVTQKATTQTGEKPVPKVEPVTGVTINKTSTTLDAGDTETLTATVAPATATNKNVTWKSSAPTIATVDASSGEVKALKAGTATITVTTEDGAKTADCALTVNAVPLVLSVDKPTIAADRTDVAKFTVKQGARDVTGDVQICMSGGECLLSNTFTTPTVGAYEFYAYFSDDASNESNRVTVTAVPPPPPFDAAQALHKNVAYFTFTATWCGDSGAFQGQMREFLASYGDNVVAVNLYESDSEQEVLSTDGLFRGFSGEMPTDIPNGRSLPTTFVGLSESLVGSGTGDYIGRLRSPYNTVMGVPAKTGIHVESSIEGGKVTPRVSVGAKTAGSYRVGVMLVEDNIVCYQNGGGDNYNHTNVLRASAVTTLFGATAESWTAGQVKSEDHSFGTAGYNIGNLFVVVYTLYNNAGNWVVDNIVKAPARGITDFKYRQGGDPPVDPDGDTNDWGDGGTIKMSLRR